MAPLVKPPQFAFASHAGDGCTVGSVDLHRRQSSAYPSEVLHVDPLQILFMGVSRKGWVNDPDPLRLQCTVCSFNIHGEILATF